MPCWTGRGPANSEGDGREQRSLSTRDTLDGHTIVPLAPQRPGVHQLGGVEYQSMSDKTVEVLGVEEMLGLSHVRTESENGYGKSARLLGLHPHTPRRRPPFHYAPSSPRGHQDPIWFSLPGTF